ncbi:MAG: hypothetical protein JHC35_01110 [Sulfuricurvum sp.]|jgi:GGDEF domain-containing protein|uniref:hypothetical protein n=1 Tax=Sulfuricurvum sp. TaxID=2025608 RepID=UPI0025CE8F57|nr:hypothetical protein [Sulfuricurvum sp.]MCI4405864.1 hypothetical protein [Sulfuricurvum sp.]
MLLSIKKIFSNIRSALFLLVLGVALLTAQLLLLSGYTSRLDQLKTQHLLVDKILNTKSGDPQMVSIAINATVAEIDLAVKLSSQKNFLETLYDSDNEFSPLIRSLENSSETFQNSSLAWSSALKMPRSEIEYAQVKKAKTAFITDIDNLMLHTLENLNNSLKTAKITAIVLLVLSLLIFLRYRYRLIQVYKDIDTACALDTTGEQKTASTQEIDFILKRALRRNIQAPSACSGLVNPSSGLNNLKGLLTVYNTKKTNRASNTTFLAVFEIDQYRTHLSTLSKEDRGNIFKKIGDIIALYEQPLDITAHLDDDHVVCVLSRNSKQSAMEDCEKILHSVEESSFNTEKGLIKITLSGGFLLKIPVKSIEEAIDDALKLVEKAKESGGNRITQLQDRADFYR